MSGGPTHQSILIVDVEGSSGRTDPQKVALRGVLYRTLMAAFARAGLMWDSCRYEDRGDGVYFLIPPGVPKARLAGTFVRALEGVLGEGGAADTPRLRVALHAGDVAVDRHGSSGTEVDHAFGLVDSDAVRRALRAAAHARLVLVLSDDFFRATVGQRFIGLDPARYEPLDVTTKRGRVRAWLRAPEPASRPDVG
jgi:hypothetical protein